MHENISQYPVILIEKYPKKFSLLFLLLHKVGPVFSFHNNMYDKVIIYKICGDCIFNYKEMESYSKACMHRTL